ncbi:histidine phosphatase family protein [Candidatus Saccharibacteria bacterium]|nr:histidine phosphatase family protein [Candidatus Saccharibacteria bacterium]MCL1963052.1 histidine phosphatase family protein [Candidatus Saccharibacteria bacterium]
MKLYFVRHGVTDWNIEKRRSGQTDIPQLVDEGRKHARQAGEKLKDSKIDVIFVSPLNRAHETAEIINEYLNAKIIVRNELIERDFGNFEDKKATADEWDKFWDYNNPSTTGESIQDLFKRVHDFIDEIKREYTDKNVLIVSHGGPARAVRFYFEKMPADGKIVEFCPPNSEILEYEIKD